MIPVTCDPEGKLDRVSLDEIEEFQGGLKSLGKTEYSKLKQSITEKGFVVPCFAWRNGSGKWKLLDGHQRVRVIRTEGWTIEGGIPVVEIVAENERDAKEKLLAIVSRYGRVEGQGLYEFLDGTGIDLEEWTVPDLPDLDLDSWLDEFIRDPEVPPGDPEAVPEVPEEATTQRGDLWVLGDHRVLCGDATSVDDVEKLMGGEVASLLISSPPYFNARKYNESKIQRVELKNGNRANNVASTWECFDDYLRCMGIVVENFVGKSNPEMMVCWNIAAISDQYGSYDIPAYTSVLFDKMGLKFFDRLIWKKTAPVFSVPRSMHIEKGHYFPAYCYEDILIYGTNHLSFDMSDKSDVRSWQTNVWEMSTVATNDIKSNEGHPAQYPMELPSRLIKSYSQKGFSIYDPFLGSGTTLIAAEKQGRRCFGLEIEPKYVDVIVKRWEDYTGKTAVLEQSKAA